MALSNIEKHYNKHPEDLRLQRRHGIVEFETTMYHLRRLLRPGMLLLDIGAGTGRYASALMAEGYKVKAVELVRRNIEVFRQRDPEAPAGPALSSHRREGETQGAARGPTGDEARRTDLRGLPDERV